MRISVVDDVAGAAVEIVEEAVRAGGHIALSGGSTPKAVYEQVEDWGDATLWFGDDRAVPPDHEHSNFRMVREALGARAARIERILGEQGAEAAAADYEARLRAALGELPRLDLALMGLGPDSHTASLFPGKPEVETTSRLAVAVPVAGMEPQVPRVSLTLPVFDNAARVVFLVKGADKAEAMRRAFGDPPDLASPAARVRPRDGELLVLCDAAAAGEL